VQAGALDKLDTLPLLARTPELWGRSALSDPVSLLIDHAFLEKKAANNAMELMTRWPNDWLPGWVETMTGIARDEAAHLAQVVRILTRRGGRLTRVHKNPYANDLRHLVRKGEREELLDRLFVSALIEARSCERFALLAAASDDEELASLYTSLFASELGHYMVFLRLAEAIDPRSVSGSQKYEVSRWQQMLAAEAQIIRAQPPGPRIHSGCSSA
jgi:tRNA-(ms[2]io[6]A)-hydroxylase